MRLYLSSFRLGDHPERMLDLLAPSGPVAVIANAVDDHPAETRRADVEREFGLLGGLGIEAEELDLRDYLHHSDGPYPDGPYPGENAGLAEALGRNRMLWVRGGNVFLLNYLLVRTGAGAIVAGLLAADTLVYAGYSAGICVLTPSLHGLETCDDPAAVQQAYGEPACFEGLGILDYAIIPHLHTPEHPENAVLEQVAERYRRQGIRHRRLRDGQALVVNGSVPELV